MFRHITDDAMTRALYYINSPGTIFLGYICTTASVLANCCYKPAVFENR